MAVTTSCSVGLGWGRGARGSEWGWQGKELGKDTCSSQGAARPWLCAAGEPFAMRCSAGLRDTGAVAATQASAKFGC